MKTIDEPGLAAFPVVLTIPVQWGDEDSFGHVNNTVYLRWCESARVEYLIRIGLWSQREGDGVGPILASITCDYERAVTFPDTVRVGARVTRIGNTSIRMEHIVVSEAMRSRAAKVHSTLVVLDYDRHKPVPVPAAVREAIGRLESQAGNSL